MAIYHLHVKVIGRKSGSSAVASAAYRSGSRLRDERLDRSHDLSGKRGVVHSEVMLPENAPQAWSDRERLWNDVEAFEVRKDAQLAREVEFAIPRGMSEAHFQSRAGRNAPTTDRDKDGAPAQPGGAQPASGRKGTT